MSGGDALRLPELRLDGREKTTGAARYTADLRFPDALQMVLVRSPFAHARIRAVDTAAARAIPGVRAVLTGADVRPARLGRQLQDWPVLCWDRVLFVGDRVAAIAADTLAIAEAAARSVQVDYEELPALLDPDAATRPGVPPLHPEAAGYRYLGASGRPPAVPHPNYQGYVRESRGDVDAAFAGAARIFEHEFTTPRVHQAALEPHVAVLWIDAETVHVRSTNKAPFSVRDQMAASLGLSPQRIVVDNGTIGGDFGGKGLSVDEFVLYFLARATGRPVRAVTRYADELTTLNPRHAARIRLRTGVDRDGRIVAHTARAIFDGGAYAAGKPTARLIVESGLTSLEGYRVPAYRLEAGTVYTNQVPGGHMRAPGQPQNVFASESHLDLIAQGLGIAPLELRRRNAAGPGDPTTAGEPWQGPAMATLLDRAATLLDQRGPLRPWRGRGYALGVRHVGRGTATVSLHLHADGQVEVRTGVPDQGGGQHTLIGRIVAAGLGIPADRVWVTRLSTAGPRDPGIGGSRVTPVHGGAALAAATELRERLAGATVEAAAARLGPGETLEVSVTREASDVDHSACAHAVEVEVDPSTGMVQVRDAVLVVDVGQAINPISLRGQLEGGFVYGLGMALMEDLAMADGRPAAGNLGDYKIPTIADIPALRIELVSDGSGAGPFGARSAGELANPGVPAAIANAVAAAAGVRVHDLPITAERVWHELRRAAAPVAAADAPRLADPSR